MVRVFRAQGAWVREGSGVWLLGCMCRIMKDRPKAYLSGPPSTAVVGGSQVVRKLWLESIKSVLNLMKLLCSQPLTIKHDLYIIHTECALSTGMPNKTTSSAKFMNPFISTLDPHS